jgi:Na+/H+ antiporter
MEAFETLLLLLLSATVLSSVARRFNLPYPTLLAIAGALLAFIPNAPRLAIPPNLILALFVAPILLDAAFDTSWRDMRRNWVAISSLSLVAVAATAAAVAVCAHALIPDLPWGAAIALGALVAPPDAVAALAVLRQVNPPQQIRAVLEGESLLNDASSLLIYRLAVGAVAAGSFHPAAAAPAFVLVFFGSVAAGWVLAHAFGWISAQIEDAPRTVIVQFVGTFGIWIGAEHFHLSGVVTIVVFGITLAQRTATPMSARLRIPSFAIWETVTVVLNVLAFTVVGLQLRPILDDLTRAQRIEYLGFAFIVLAVVIGVRLAWVMTHHLVSKAISAAAGRSGTTTKGAVVIGWSGMRGIVTIAAATALPAGFPYRDFIQLTAFVVVLGTLVVQGLTLGPLIKLLNLPKDTALEQEVAVAREAALKSALDNLKGDRTAAARRLREEVETALAGAEAGERDGPTSDQQLRRRTVAASRKAIEDLRHSGAIGDTAYRQVEEGLDWFELAAQGTAQEGGPP